MSAALPEATNDDTAAEVQIRRSATWMIAAFAAVGTALAGSLTLQTLSDFTGHWGWLVAAGLAFLGAMYGIAVAIGATAELLLPVLYTYQDAKTDVSNPTLNRPNPLWFGMSNTPSQAMDDLRTQLGKVQTAATEADRIAAQTAATKLKNGLENWIKWRQLQKLDETYKRVMPKIKRGVLYATLGALSFAGFRALAADPMNDLVEREKDVVKREKEVAAKEATPTELFSYPVAATWTPKPNSAEGCPSGTPVKVNILSMSKVPTSPVNPTLVTEADLVTLDGPEGCVGRYLTFRPAVNELTIPQQEIKVDPNK